VNVHEDLSREETSVSSNRQFALVFIAGWSLIGLAPLRRCLPVRWWAEFVNALETARMRKL
jgi:hypothetical protein